MDLVSCVKYDGAASKPSKQNGKNRIFLVLASLITKTFRILFDFVTFFV